LNPETGVEAVQTIAPLCDMVLVMTVHPGFGAQKFIPQAAEKVIKVREIVGPDVRVEVDGGIDPKIAPLVVSYGADTLVAGNAIFSNSDRVAAINAIREWISFRTRMNLAKPKDTTSYSVRSCPSYISFSRQTLLSA
jgi:ribulose-phosphate 3-epimerase